MRCSLKNKSATKHKETWTITHPHSRCLVIPIRGTSNVHDTVNVCMFCSNILLRPSFGMSYKQQTLYFYPLKSNRCPALRDQCLSACAVRRLTGSWLQIYNFYLYFDALSRKKWKNVEFCRIKKVFIVLMSETLCLCDWNGVVLCPKCSVFLSGTKKEWW